MKTVPERSTESSLKVPSLFQVPEKCSEMVMEMTSLDTLGLLLLGVSSKLDEKLREMLLRDCICFDLLGECASALPGPDSDRVNGDDIERDIEALLSALKAILAGDRRDTRCLHAKQ